MRVVGVLLVGCLASIQGLAQVWHYHDLLTDVQQSGQFPDLTQDSLGGLHACYWNGAEDRLVYAFLPPAASTWTFESVEAASAAGGYRCAIALDDNAQPHISYHGNEGGLARVRYAFRSPSGVWAAADVSSRLVGNYGPQWMSGFGKIHLSTDLVWRQTPGVLLGYFDGTFESCLSTDDIQLKGRYVVNNGGGWQDSSMGTFGTGFNSHADFNCESEAMAGPLGQLMRYGEFLRFVAPPSGPVKAFSVSKNVSDISVLTETPGPPGSPVGFSGLTRILAQFALPGIAHSDTAGPTTGFSPQLWDRERFSFEGLDVTTTPDGHYHLAMTLSENYGENDRVTTWDVGNAANHTLPRQSKLLLVYQRLNSNLSPDTVVYIGPQPLSSPTHTLYRAWTNLATRGNDTLAMTYVNVSDDRYELAISTDGGDTWATEEIGSGINAARMPAAVEIRNDTVHVLLYDQTAEALVHAKREVVGSPFAWSLTPLTRTTRVGERQASFLRSTPAGDSLYLVFTDAPNRLLIYGKGTQAGLVLDTVGAAGSVFNELDLWVSDDGVPHILAANATAGELQHWTPQAGGWVNRVASTNLSGPGELIGIAGFNGAGNDILYALYYNADNRRLEYSFQTSAFSAWEPARFIDELDTLQVYKFTDITLGATNNPHVVAVKENLGAVPQRFETDYWFGNIPTLSSGWVRDTLDRFSPDEVITGLSLALNAQGRARLALQRFSIADDTTHIYRERIAPNNWSREGIASFFAGQDAPPLQLRIDSLGNPWLMTGRLSVPEEVQLLARNVGDTTGWSNFFVDNNVPNGRIAQQVGFFLTGNRLYLVGRKTRDRDNGLALLQVSDWPAEVDTPDVVVRPEAWVGLAASLYPNPARNLATLSVELPEALPIHVALVAMDGRRVFEQAYPAVSKHRVQLSLGDLPAGLYSWRMQAAGRSLNGRLVVVR